MEQYKFLDQFYKDAFIKQQEIIKQEIEINSCVDTLTKGIAISEDKAVDKDNVNKIILNKSQLEDILKLL